jgi:N-acetylglucosamine-6-phosphate deacetylase
LPRDSISYTTDAMAAASMPPGRYHLGRLTVEVGEDQVVREPGKTNLAGSALRPVDGVLRAAQMLGSSWRKAWHSFSVTPAKWLGLPGSLEVGERADFCLLKFSPEGKRLGLRVFWGGQEIQHFAQDPADGES